jgi:hypothetical protein
MARLSQKKNAADDEHWRHSFCRATPGYFASGVIWCSWLLILLVAGSLP